jgi:quercetin dioxygenase-like cupin family protein
MPRYVRREDVQGITGPGHVSYPMLGPQHGCANGFSSGFTICHGTEYNPPGAHDDQEGFVVMEGRGWAKVGNEEFRVAPDTCFIVPAGVPHALKKDPDSPDLKVCWFHGA